MGEPGNTLDEATESENKKVALLIAVLALFLALSEAGAKKAEHHSTEKNIESSDLYNFYQAKKARSTMFETAAKSIEILTPSLADEKTREAAEKQIASWGRGGAGGGRGPGGPGGSRGGSRGRAREA